MTIKRVNAWTCLEKRLARGESLLNKTFQSEVKSLFPGNIKRNRNLPEIHALVQIAPHYGTPRMLLNVFILFFNTKSILYWGITNNNVVVVSDEQQSDSAIHIHVLIIPQIPLPSRLAHNIEQSSRVFLIPI